LKPSPRCAVTNRGRKNTVTLVPRSNDILAVTASRIIERAASLPDLSRTIVLLPELQFAPRLRRQLLLQAYQHGHGALLGPVITTIEQWLREQHPVPQLIPGRARRELMLVEVLLQHPDVFKDSNPWQLGTSLVSLFDELTLNRVSIPGDLPAFTEQLQQAYGIAGDIDDTLPEPLGMEAGIVHRLWKAWHVQLASNDMLDPGVAALQRLAMSRDRQDECYYYCVGYDSINTATGEWLASLLAANRAECLLYPHDYRPEKRLDGNQATPLQTLLQPAAVVVNDQPASQCLDAIFRTGTASLAERASTFGKTHADSPLADRIAVFPANSAEQEARAIDLQVRQWLSYRRLSRQLGRAGSTRH